MNFVHVTWNFLPVAELQRPGYHRVTSRWKFEKKHL